MSWRLQLYGYGMMICGYAAGKRIHTEWIATPWWADFSAGVTLLVIAFVLNCRVGRRKGRLAVDG